MEIKVWANRVEETDTTFAFWMGWAEFFRDGHQVDVFWTWGAASEAEAIADVLKLASRKHQQLFGVDGEQEGVA